MAGTRNTQNISIFISSKMLELVDERKAVQAALAQYHMEGWLWEKDAGANPAAVRKTYLKQVEDSDLYIGLFWRGYGPYTIEEYHHARDCDIPCLIYEKHIDLDGRDPNLQNFLDGIGHPENDTGVSICRFTTTAELVNRVQEDVMRVIASIISAKKEARDKRNKYNKPNNSGHHNISIGRDHIGDINQYSNGRDSK